MIKAVSNSSWTFATVREREKAPDLINIDNCLRLGTESFEATELGDPISVVNISELA